MGLKMREYCRRMSYLTTLVIPIAVALVIAFVGLTHPQWPRVYFIIGFLAALILLPGVTLGLKLSCTPVVEEDVEFLGTYGPGWIGVRHANGAVARYHHRGLYEMHQSGHVRRGERLRLRFLEQEIISWELLED